MRGFLKRWLGLDADLDDIYERIEELEGLLAKEDDDVTETDERLANLEDRISALEEARAEKKKKKR